MNPRHRLYIMAFAIYTSTLLVTTALAWLAIQYNTAASSVQLAVSVTGNGLGGIALVLGILKDNRFEQERKRADDATESAKKSDQEAVKARQQAEQFQKLAEQLQQQVEQQRQQTEHQVEQQRQQAEQQRQQADQERQRAERAEAEVQRMRAEHERELAFRLRRLEIAAGIAPPDAPDDDTEN